MDYKPKCFDKGGTHSDEYLEEIYTSGYEDIYDSVKWCKECGAIVVDNVVDRIIMAGNVKEMKFSNLLKKIL
jgi:reverse gyrase